MKNKNMHAAKKNKNDEFYTQMSDISRELFRYKRHFKGKKIFLNCDDPETSDFWMYFTLNFDFFGLKKLTATHYEVDKPSYKLEMAKYQESTRTALEGNGDFRSPEAIAILEDSDIVVTNPPFSLFREYIAQLMEYGKKFAVIGNMNAITYKETFKLIKDNRLWLGYTSPKEFKQPDGTTKKFGNILWFTNLEISKRNEEMILYKKYYGNEDYYPKYDNYNAINVNKVRDIPCDYEGVIGVPITFVDSYSPKQFEVIALGIVGSIEFSCNKKMEILDKNGLRTGRFTHNAKGTLYRKYEPLTDRKPAFMDVETGELYVSIYARILIKNKNPKAGI